MYIKVKAITNSRKENVIKEGDDHYVISVRQKAEKNMANKRIMEIMKSMFPKKVIRMIKGSKSPSKLVMVED